MSDYLTHVAARAIDAAAMIRPRLVSFYEPPAITTATPELEVVDTAIEAKPAGARPARVADPQDRSPHERPATTEAMKETSVIRTEVLREVDRVVMPAASRETHTGRIEAMKAEPPTESAAPPHVPPRIDARQEGKPLVRSVAAEQLPPPADRSPVARERAAERAVERVVERIREVAAPPQERRIVIERATPLRTTETNAPPPIVERTVVVQREIAPGQAPALAPREPVPRDLLPSPRVERPVKIPTQIIVEPRATPRPQAPATERVVAQEPDAAPSIEVTIGRIEVRAVPAAEPPRPSATPASALMSLDDYLRRRSERVRR